MLRLDSLESATGIDHRLNIYTDNPKLQAQIAQGVKEDKTRRLKEKSKKVQ